MKETFTDDLFKRTYVQQVPIVAPLVNEVTIPEPEIGIEAPAQHDLTSTAEDSPAVFTSELEISYSIEVTPAAIDHSLLAESGGLDDENVINQSKSKTKELQSELEQEVDFRCFS